MGLETGTYIDSLVATNPLGTDSKKQGDDHIRLIKSTLLATFPNITGAVTPTHTELNYVDGVTSAIQTQIDAKLDLNVSATQKLLGRDTAGAGDAEEIAITDVLDWITSTRGDLLVKGASAWQQLAIGAAGTFLKSDGTDPSWATGGLLTNLVQGESVGTGTTYTVDSIPAGVEKVEITLSGQSFDADGDLRARLGYGGGSTLQTTGYAGRLLANDESTSEDWASSQHCVFSSGATASQTFIFKIELTHMGSDTWVISGNSVIQNAGTNGGLFGGTVTLSGTLDKITFSTDGAGSFDAGTCTVNYYG